MPLNSCSINDESIGDIRSENLISTSVRLAAAYLRMNNQLLTLRSIGTPTQKNNYDAVSLDTPNVKTPNAKYQTEVDTKMSLKRSDNIEDIDRLTKLEHKPEFLIKWINACLKTDISTIKELCTGKYYCDFMRLVYSQSLTDDVVNFSSIRWDTIDDFARNFKLLQQSFDLLGIAKSIPINALIHGDTYENGEFLQWFYNFFNCLYEAKG